jgi:hypothetical protein
MTTSNLTQQLRAHRTGQDMMTVAYEQSMSQPYGQAMRGYHAWGFALACSALPEILWRYGYGFSVDAQQAEHKWATAHRRR